MLKNEIFLISTILTLTLSGFSKEIKHRFLAVDESRNQVHYVNQFTPSKNWTISTNTKVRDIQLIGHNQFLLSTTTGYVVYNLVNKKIVKTVSAMEFEGATSVRRLPNGQTLIGCNNNGITIFKLSPNDEIIKTTNFPKLKQLRLMRITEKKSLIFGCNESLIAEVNLDGKILKQINIKSGRHIYQVLELSKGNIIASHGYGGSLGIINPAGEITKMIGDVSKVNTIKPFFYAGFQVLKNKNLVVSHWTGHGKNDSSKAPQLLEFNPKGEMVWSWHDPKIAGSIHGVLILDQLDTNFLHSEIRGILTPPKKVLTQDTSSHEVPEKSNHAEEALTLLTKTARYVRHYIDQPKVDQQIKQFRDLLAQGENLILVEQVIRRFRRELLFRHPDLTFKNLLINKRALHGYGQKHMIDQYLGHLSKPAEGLVVLSDWKTNPIEKPLLTGKLPIGDCRHPALSYDGKKILFTYAIQNTDRWKQQFFIYEIKTDGSGLRQITGTSKDAMVGKDNRKTQIIEDFDPCYLADDSIIFVSTRIQGHVRCAYGVRYNPTFCLYRMNNDGSHITQLSYGDIAEYDPEILPDGRIIYTRWEYNNRHDTWFQGLWTIRPDGTGTAHYYGNYTRSPCVIAEAKPIPGTRQVMANATAHHWYYTGSMIDIDVRKGEDGDAPLTKLTPEVPFPETPENAAYIGKYAMPFPINKELYFVSYLEKETNQMAIFLMDRFGGKELIHRAPNTSCYAPIAIRATKRPPVIASTLNPKLGNHGIFYIQNVYESRVKIPKGEVKFLRVIKIYDQPTAFAPKVGVALGQTPFKILGDVPVEPSGSVAFKGPAGAPLYFQLLDKNKMCIMGMRTFVYLQAGETSSCIGCHEDPNMSVPVKPTGDIKIRKLIPPQSSNYPGGFSYAHTIQPILDKNCIQCHGLKNKKIPNLLAEPASKSTGPYYSPKKTFYATESYMNLIKQAKIAFRNRETYTSIPKDYYSHTAKLVPHLKKGHHNVSLTKGEMYAITSWLDLNVPMYGSWFWNQPELRETNPEAEKLLRKQIRLRFGKKMANQPLSALINIGYPEKSRILLAPLVEKAGGWQQIEPYWNHKRESSFLKIKQLVYKTIVPHTNTPINGTCGAKDRAHCKCGACWIKDKFDK